MDPNPLTACGAKRRRSPEIELTGPPMTEAEKQQMIDEAMAYQPPTAWQRVREGLKTVAGLAFFIAVLWFAWPVIKPIIGISTIEHPQATRARLAAEDENKKALISTALEIREEIIKRNAARNQQYIEWKTQALTDPKLEEALSIFDKLAADLREKHGITKARAAGLIGGMSYEELLNEAEEMKPMMDVRAWDEYVKALAPEMREALW